MVVYGKGRHHGKEGEERMIEIRRGSQFGGRFFSGGGRKSRPITGAGTKVHRAGKKRVDQDSARSEGGG